MKNEMLKERFNREDIKKVDVKDLGNMYLTTLASLISVKKEEMKKLTLCKGLYVYWTAQEKGNGCEYFGINGADAISFFKSKVEELAKCSTMYFSIGFDYWIEYPDYSRDTGAEDLIICGDSYPARSELNE